MSSSLRRGVLAAAAIVVSVAPLSGCAAGSDAQTQEIKPDNAATSVGTIKVQNVNVVTQPDRKAKGPAVITGKIFNEGARSETLKAIALPGTGARVKLSPAKKGSGPIVVPAGGSVILGGKGNPSAVIANGREAAQDGNAQRVVFDLNRTGDVPITAFVVPASGYFEGWGPTELPTATPGTPSGKPTSSPSGSPSTKPGDRPSGTPSTKPGGTTEPGGDNIAPGEPAPNDD
ncbi:DUF461 domain-containing protein [Streptomyces sp. NPDC048636]|uniref:DUF461 domain-containing protein n=1 Tax=Streptomyces sp. NPDC048636 TaxID=3155762 RepID=UPI00341340EC